jgi:hypothetical protein
LPASRGEGGGDALPYQLQCRRGNDQTRMDQVVGSGLVAAEAAVEMRVGASPVRGHAAADLAIHQVGKGSLTRLRLELLDLPGRVFGCHAQRHRHAISDRPSTRSFTRSWSRRTKPQLTCASTRLAKPQQSLTPITAVSHHVTRVTLQERCGSTARMYCRFTATLAWRVRRGWLVRYWYHEG